MAKESTPAISSIGKKLITAVTGLALCLFLVAHLAGNLLLLLGHGEAFNKYAYYLNELPFLIILELGLAAIILIHAYEAITVTLENRRARPVGYQSQAWARAKSPNSRKTTSSTNMAVSGSILLVFIVLHVLHFKYNHPVGPSVVGPPPPQNVSDMRDLYYLVVTEFKKPWILAFYLVCMAALGAHLYHAIWASFQTLGVQNAGLRKAALGIGSAFAVAIALAFAMLPLWAFFIAPIPGGAS